jgi:mannose-6-phosphate isomerase-like protein (cupin superfamily)
MDVIQRDSTTAFVTKDGSIIRELLASRNSAIRKQSLAEATVPPGVRTQSHYHPQSEEIYYVLQGEGIMHLAGQSRVIRPGDAVAIPPGQIHSIENVQEVELVFLCCCAPGYEHEDTILDHSPGFA